ncbi:MAG: DUF1499 domain-containing protein [bacterium]|nr:DUF1499 domain-containing protein [bacterium]MDT8365433.1 DUF1499 domain-containing protein [bacterium]
MKTTVIMFILLLLPVLTMANEIQDPQISQKDLDFPACPGTPNCVSSLAKDPAKRVEPFPLKGASSQSMELLSAIMGSMPRATVVSSSPDTIQAEFRSLLGFVDDILFKVSEDGKVIHVRSAARTGSWDLGVNRRRVEKIRKKYLESGI